MTLFFFLFKRLLLIGFLFFKASGALASPLNSQTHWELKQQDKENPYIQTLSLEKGKGDIILAVYPQVLSQGVISIGVFPFPTQPVTVIVWRRQNPQTFILKDHEGRLWSVDPAMDEALIKAFKEGSTLEIKQGNTLMASFSLMGFLAAFLSLSKAEELGKKKNPSQG